jgi:hypothetical protein
MHRAVVKLTHGCGDAEVAELEFVCNSRTVAAAAAAAAAAVPPATAQQVMLVHVSCSSDGHCMSPNTLRAGNERVDERQVVVVDNLGLRIVA